MLKAQNALQINVLNGNAIMNVKLNSKSMEVEMFIYLQCHTETYDVHILCSQRIYNQLTLCAWVLRVNKDVKSPYTMFPPCTATESL